MDRKEEKKYTLREKLPKHSSDQTTECDRERSKASFQWPIPGYSGKEAPDAFMDINQTQELIMQYTGHKSIIDPGLITFYHLPFHGK